MRGLRGTAVDVSHVTCAWGVWGVGRGLAEIARLELVLLQFYTVSRAIAAVHMRCASSQFGRVCERLCGGQNVCKNTRLFVFTLMHCGMCPRAAAAVLACGIGR